MRKRKASKNQKAEEELQNIDRFAGSSEDESSSSSSDNDEDDAVNESEQRNTDVKKDGVNSNDDDGSDSNESVESESENENDEHDGDEEEEDQVVRHDGFDADDDQSDDDDEGEDVELTSGMANAMNRILNSNQKSGPSVVLSKTKTPLQLMAEKEKKQQTELSDKVRRNREKRLAALVIPQISAREIERERTHRRIATRGIVALFNAIATHQQQQHQQQAEATTTTEESANKKKETKLTKTAFLEKIKETAISRSKNLEEHNTVNTKKKETTTAGESKWNALKDDYMMDSKKNWDEESSSEEEGNEKLHVKKRHKVRA